MTGVQTCALPILTGLAEARYYMLANKNTTDAEFENSIKNIFGPLEDAIDINPNNATARVVMSKTLKIIGDFSAARKVLKDALESVDKDITLTAIEKKEMKKTINNELKSL